MPSSLRWWPPCPAGRGPPTPAGRPSPQPGEPWPTSADGRTCGHAARTRTVRDQCPPARPGTPVPWLPRRSDAVAFGTDLVGFCGGEGGCGQRGRVVGWDRQQPCAVAGRQRVASLEVQAQPGPAAPGQCGITPASRRRRTACSVPASRRASRGPRGSPAVIWRTRQSVLSMFIGMSLALTQSLTAEPQARGKRSQHGLARHDGRPDAQTVRQFR